MPLSGNLTVGIAKQCFSINPMAYLHFSQTAGGDGLIRSVVIFRWQQRVHRSDDNETGIFSTVYSHRFSLLSPLARLTIGDKLDGCVCARARISRSHESPTGLNSGKLDNYNSRS